MLVEIKVFEQETNKVVSSQFHEVSSLFETNDIAASLGAVGRPSVHLSPPREEWATDLVIWVWEAGDREVVMICDFPINR